MSLLRSSNSSYQTGNLPSASSPDENASSFGSQSTLNKISLLQYYLPCFSWIPEYTWDKFVRDLVAGLSVASFQIPLALSYATSVAHVEPLSGLYSLAITPIIYAVFGSVPQMIVGPESAISLVVGQAVEQLVSHEENTDKTDIALMTTFISGMALLIAGILRLGYLGNVLSRPLLRGFISSVGVIMVVDSMITEFKLNQIFADSKTHYHTCFEKVLFLIKYVPANFHVPTTILSFSCLLVLLVTRLAKKKLMPTHRRLVFLPEILIVIILTICISYKFDFKHKYNITTVGDFNTSGFGHLRSPFSQERRSLFRSLLNTGLLVAVLGFFESTTASKSLGTTYNLAISSNRELVALGSMNVMASFFGALPSFGGYGRSKVNAFSGAQTVMSGTLMGVITLITIKTLLRCIHYIPICVLSVITTIVGISLLEEAPSELKFHWNCRGYDELFVFALTVLATVFYSVETGICIGCGYSVLTIIKHCAKSRIQILARLEKDSTHFVNADDYAEDRGKTILSSNVSLQHIEGCLIVKIPEPLTFTNSEDLKQRLNRLERFGSVHAHPGQLQVRSTDLTKFVIFDLHGMTSMDSSAAQILFEVVTSYKKRNVFILFARVSPQSQVRDRLQKSGVTKLLVTCPKNSALSSSSSESYDIFFRSIDDALRHVEWMERRGFNLEESSTTESFMSLALINSNIV